MIEKIKEQAWGWVGKAAALLGLILLVFQVADRIGQPAYKMAAVAEKYPLVIPSAFDQAVRNVMASVQGDTARTLMSSDDLAAIDGFLTQEQVVLVTVANKGQRELSNVVLETPTSGYYSPFPGQSIEEVRSDFELATLGRPDQTVSRFESDIIVGSLRPASQVTLVLWTTSSFFFDPEEYRVTHPFGAIQVDFPDYEHSWFDNFGYLVVVMLLLLGVVLVWGIRSEKRQRERIERVEATIEKLADTVVSTPSRAQ